MPGDKEDNETGNKGDNMACNEGDYVASNEGDDSAGNEEGDMAGDEEGNETSNEEDDMASDPSVHCQGEGFKAINERLIRYTESYSSCFLVCSVVTLTLPHHSLLVMLANQNDREEDYTLQHGPFSLVDHHCTSGTSGGHQGL